MKVLTFHDRKGIGVNPTSVKSLEFKKRKTLKNFGKIFLSRFVNNVQYTLLLLATCYVKNTSHDHYTTLRFLSTFQ